jgi:transcriptional regulator with XRE-family HTH domain
VPSLEKKRTPLGQFLISEREKRKWNQAKLSVEAGVGMATVVRLETGATDLREVRVGTLQDLARALDTDTARLVELAEEEGE